MPYYFYVIQKLQTFLNFMNTLKKKNIDEYLHITFTRKKICHSFHYFSFIRACTFHHDIINKNYF